MQNKDLTRILIVEEQQIIRDAMSALLRLEDDFLVAGQTGSGRDALEIVETRKPDIILLDIPLMDLNGIHVLKELRRRQNPAKILILTIYEDGNLLHEILRCGANGYITKRATGQELCNAIRFVVSGNRYIHPSLTHYLLDSIYPNDKSQNHEEKRLTRREREIFDLISQGYTNSYIAAKLVISVRTVEKHRSNAMHKLNLHSRADIYHYIKNQLY